MKKLFSILFAALILLSGMNLSLASHYCGGELSAVKWSLNDAKAGCGMELAATKTSSDKSFEAQSCCKDEISFYTVDHNYNQSTHQINEPVHQLLQVFYIPETIGFHFFNTSSSVNATIHPPGKFIASAVSLPDICVFRI